MVKSYGPYYFNEKNSPMSTKNVEIKQINNKVQQGEFLHEAICKSDASREFSQVFFEFGLLLARTHEQCNTLLYLMEVWDMKYQFYRHIHHTSSFSFLYLCQIC